jgi:hypothetical protein
MAEHQLTVADVVRKVTVYLAALADRSRHALPLAA